MKLATICYIFKDDEVLMIHRNKREDDYHKDRYNGVGGKFEIAEDPYDCARREILEETGLTVNDLDYRGFITFPNFDGNEDWHCFVFIVDEFEGTLGECPEGDLVWVKKSEILNLNLWEGDEVFIPWVFERKNRFMAKFKYENSKFVDYDVKFLD